MFSKNQYAAITGRNQGKNDVLAYHLRISFKPGETDAATANKIGYDLAMKLTHGQHAFVCCTHTDKSHVHSHIIINSTNLDCTRKFRNFKGSAFVIRKIADQLCLENGLSVIEKPKPSRGSYGKWLGDEKQPTNREILEQMIDTALENCKDYNNFIANMKSAGCEIKHGKHLSIKIPGASRFARLKSLSEDYTEEAIRERIFGKRIVKPKKKIVTIVATAQSDYSPTLLINIEAKLQKAHSPGYEHWARIHNLKEMARTLIFLKDCGIGTYDELNKKINVIDAEHSSKLKRIKEIEARQKEISELQRHIGTYGKTKDTYTEYQRLKKHQPTAWEKMKNAARPANDYYEACRADITLHEAAKNYFNAQGYGKNKKIPTMQNLKIEYAKLQAEKKKLYSGYKEQREEVKSLKTARRNVDMFLGEPRQSEHNKSREHNL